MPKKSHIVLGVIVAVAVTDSLWTRHSAKQDREHSSAAYFNLLRENAFTLLELDYLYEKLYEHDVSVDDFDLIAINYQRHQASGE